MSIRLNVVLESARLETQHSTSFQHHDSMGVWSHDHGLASLFKDAYSGISLVGLSLVDDHPVALLQRQQAAHSQKSVHVAV
jgi:hypothetical protein